MLRGMEGSCSEKFAGVKASFEQNFAERGEVGASVCVIHDGDVVVDLWSGVGTDIHGNDKPWERDSIINCWSLTKTMMYLCAYLLVDRGELDFDAPVAHYWPKFAQNGKAGVLVRHIMSHTSGLSGFGEPLTPDDVCDWGKVVGVLERQEPWWEPGTQSGYQALTQGYLIGEVVRRITGNTLGRFYAEEFATPLGADFQIGTPAAHDSRVLRVIPPSGPLGGGAASDSIAARTFSTPRLGAEFSWTEAWRRCESPAANGHGNARSVATAQSVMAGLGEAGGRRYFSEATARRVYDVQADGTDLALARPLKLGMGYGLVSKEVPIAPSETAFWWGGWGGSLVVIDPAKRLTVAYVMNKMEDGTVGDLRAAMLVYAAHGAVGAAG
jgi:CubicO group peptidase (beta-lactamase class C family)